jgi:threonine/homoserine/homoserine lactone efflux protein
MEGGVIDAANLWLYFLLVFGIIVLPGMDMAYVSGSALVGGLRAGFAAVAGIVVGGAYHTAMGAFGVAAIMRTWPVLFHTMVIGGVLYFAWIGYSLARVKAGFSSAHQRDTASPAMLFRGALLTCLANPKAYLFTFAVFPQFIKAERGAVLPQAMLLGAITMYTQAAVYGGVAMLSDRAGGWLGTSPSANLWMARIVGVLFIVAAIITGIEGLRIALRMAAV